MKKLFLAALLQAAAFTITLGQDRWYKNAVIYNLDVHTFQDSDGDGIGDFKGLTARLPYLKDLGVDVIWLAPFQPSPHKDDGYDITDYYGIDSTCGTPGDFTAFMYEAGQLGLRVIMDIVIDHSSDQHPWFLRAAADSSSPFHSWYVWSKETPANRFKGIAFPGVQKEIWTWNEQAHAWYYHRFYNFQPHLNYLNPAVQTECRHILGYWLAQGMSGFRLDAVPFIVEIPNRTSDKAAHDSLLIPALRQSVQWQKGDALLLGEANVLPKENVQYFGSNGEGLHMMFNFYGNQYLFYGLATGDITLFRHAIRATGDIDPLCQWVWFLRNHDEIDLGRLTDEQRQTVYRRMAPEKNMQLYDRGIRRRLAPMLHDPKELAMSYSLLFSLPGAPLIRYGEELGMGDDLSLKERLSIRTPMQWSGEKNAGFTTSPHPIRPLIEEGEYAYQKINVTDESFDPHSLLNHIRSLIRLRKECPEIGLGKYSIPDSSNTHILVMRYDYKEKTLLILHNFSPDAERVILPDMDTRTDLFTGKDEKGDTITLNGYGFKWYRLHHSTAATKE